MSEATSATGGIAGARPGARWRPWLVAALALWVAVGVALVDRANRAGQVADIELSPSHLVAYGALVVLAAYVLWAFIGALRHGRWRAAFPAGYAGLGVAVVAAIGWIVLDGIWRSTLGIFGLEGALAPPRLLIPIAVAAVASAPVIEALRSGRSLTTLGMAAPAVVAAAVLGSAFTLSAFNPVREPRNDWSFEPQRDQSEVWTMAADGSGQTRVLASTEVGVDFSLPAWSPDGKRIAYTQWQNLPGVAVNLQNADQTASIWTMAADGSDRREVAKPGAGDEAWIPSWSPDGQWIGYTASGQGHGAASGAQPQAGNAPGQVGPPAAIGESHLWVVHPDGSGAHAVTSGAAATGELAWSPDGRHVAFHSTDASGNLDIHIATFADGALTDERPVAPDPAVDGGPAWSPDGTRIAFSSNRSGGDDIWVVNVDGSGLARLTDDRGGDWVPAWSPDGKRILFVSDRGGDVEVWSMAGDGSDLRDLSNSPGSNDGQWSVSVAPDGRIAFARTAYPVGAAGDFARFDLAAAQTLLWALSLAVVALLVVAIGAPLGGFTLAFGAMVLLAAIPTDQWRFLPAAIVAGVLTDLVVRVGPARQRARLAAMAMPAFGVLAVEATLAAAGAQAWSITLVLGIAIAAALLGLGLAAIARRLAPATA